MEPRPPLPPFSAETAAQKVRMAEDAWHDDSGQWFRSHGNENWQFNARGYMEQRHASINDRPIAAGERLFQWPSGRRPDEHPGLSALGL